ncbi:MAG: sulfatase-like hydrolase/transferase [Acidobacteria bacterium]|nr:sulfatase-like hydrolase/transferase [Acidobacteriota bacterium]
MSQTLHRRTFLSRLGSAALGAASLACSGSSEQSPAADAKPNIVIVFADDMGFQDAGFQGSPDCETPHLDALAREGVRFDNGYVTHPFCSPSRAALLTGRYQQRFGHENNMVFDLQDRETGLPLNEITLANLLGDAGYTTGLVGKWHLGAHPIYHPFRRGFQHMYGFVGGGHDYFDPGAPGQTEQHLIPIERDGEVVPETEYLTTALGREAASFVRQRADDEPFFLYLAFNAPHTPLQAPDEMLARFASIEDPGRRTYAAMVWALDDAVGRLEAALAETGRKDNTLLFFLNDNGGPAGNKSSNAPLRGTKRTLYEGGVRVPFLVRWPGHIEPGSTYSRPVSSLDVLPTALAAAGVAPPADRPLDGVDLLPYLSGNQSGVPHQRLFWRCFDGVEAAVREGDWKWVRVGREARPELYDLSTDLSEKYDVSADHPEIVAELGAAWEQWNAQMVPSLWPDHIFHVREGNRWR